MILLHYFWTAQLRCSAKKLSHMWGNMIPFRLKEWKQNSKADRSAAKAVWQVIQGIRNGGTKEEWYTVYIKKLENIVPMTHLPLQFTSSNSLPCEVQNKKPSQWSIQWRSSSVNFERWGNTYQPPFWRLTSSQDLKATTLWENIPHAWSN